MDCNVYQLLDASAKQVIVKTANKLIQQKFEIPVVFFSADKLFDEATLSSVLEKVRRIYSLIEMRRLALQDSRCEL